MSGLTSFNIVGGGDQKMIDTEWCPKCQKNVQIEAEREEIITKGVKETIFKKWCCKCGQDLGDFKVLEIEGGEK